MRLKLYDKTAERLTSFGVSNTNIGDPIGEILHSNK